MNTRKLMKKTTTWKDAPIVELSVRELASAAGGRRIIEYGSSCGCGKKCKHDEK